MSDVCVCSSCGEKLGGFSVSHQGYAVMHRDRADCIRLLRTAHDRDLARAYWRGMLAPMIAEAERAHRRLTISGAVAIDIQGGTDDGVRALDAGYFARRAARLRAIADGPMWEPWYARKVGA